MVLRSVISRKYFEFLSKNLVFKYFNHILSKKLTKNHIEIWSIQVEIKTWWLIDSKFQLFIWLLSGDFIIINYLNMFALSQNLDNNTTQIC